MKNVILILALVFTYGIAISGTTKSNVSLEDQQITVVAEDNDVSEFTFEDEKEKDKKEKKVKKKTSEGCTGKTKAATGCSEAQKKSCAASKKCCGETKKK